MQGISCGGSDEKVWWRCSRVLCVMLTLRSDYHRVELVGGNIIAPQPNVGYFPLIGALTRRYEFLAGN